MKHCSYLFYCLIDVRDVAEMSGVTKLDRIRNERIRGTTKVGDYIQKSSGK